MIDIEKEIKRLKETYNSQGKPTSRTLDELEILIKKHPNSARLWDYRGNVILSEDDNDPRYELKDAKASYLMAIEKDPEYAIAYESLGYYYDVYKDSIEEAERYFKKSLSLAESIDSYLGLARVLAELNKEEEALSLLTKKNCPFHADIEIKQLKDEIKEGYWSTNI